MWSHSNYRCLRSPIVSKAQQRWDNCVAAGRKAGLNGDRPDCNPYIHPRGRSAWYKGHEQGSVERRKRARVAKRKDRVDSMEGWPVSRLWRVWYAFTDLFSGKVASTAQAPARKRGFGL